MQLSDIMTRNVKTLSPDAALQQAAQMMAALDVGVLPVADDGDLLGMITDRDITVRATARGLDPKTTPVRKAMTELVVCGFETQEIEEAARLMMNNQVRRLPVLNRDNKLVGVVSLGDLSTRGVEDEALAGLVLERISETAVPMS
jgi:CBS domain-containing protein